MGLGNLLKEVINDTDVKEDDDYDSDHHNSEEHDSFLQEFEKSNSKKLNTMNL